MPQRIPRGPAGFGSIRFFMIAAGLGVFLDGPTTGSLRAQGVAAAQITQSPKSPRFERDVRPILEAHCLKCHGAKLKKSGLDLRDVPAIHRGADGGPVLVPGKSDESPLYEQVATETMPPGKTGKLSESERAMLKAWIDAGAPADATDSASKPALPSSTSDPSQSADSRIPPEARRHWAFRPTANVAVPTVRDRDRARTAIDAFVLERLEAKGLGFSPEAERHVLLRRACFDLLGLPPSPEQIDEYLADARPDAYERLIDRLLASPQYGERWGRHWLDAAGYSDIAGTDNDAAIVRLRDGIWRYRDYVVRAVNADKPYDRFLIEQLAGDQIVDWKNSTGAHYTPEILDSLIATGFLRTSIDDTTEAELNRPLKRFEVLNRTIENVTSNVLGLTVACAQCHDHKFDPIPQRDYYRLMAVLTPAYNPWSWKQPTDRFLADVPLPERKAIDDHNAAIDRKLAELDKERAALVKAGHKEKETAAIDRRKVGLTATKRSYRPIQALWDVGPAPATPLLKRGNPETPGAAVSAGFLAVLGDADCAPGLDDRRRLALAKWLTRPGTPAASLVARVWVNRAWMHHFGHPLVATPGNFGINGATPTHPELLDWLADSLIRSGWRTKAIHRAIMTSSVYRQAAHPEPDGSKTLDPAVVDPENRLFARMPLRRLEAEAIRDALLAASGSLDRRFGGPPIPLDAQADGRVVVAEKQLANPGDRDRRGLYLMARRNYLPSLLSVFDAPLMTGNCTQRVTSVVPSQALTMLNNTFIVEQAERISGRIVGELPTPAPLLRVDRAFRLILSRPPTAGECRDAAALIGQQTSQLRASDPKIPARDADRRALDNLCLMLLNTNEFLYVD